MNLALTLGCIPDKLGVNRTLSRVIRKFQYISLDCTLMTVADEIDRSVALIQWLDTQLNGVSLSSDDRPRLSAAAFDVAHEHHKAIVLLIHNRLIGSAFALVRPLLESYLRGEWILNCASDRGLALVIADKKRPGFDQLVDDLEALEGFREGVLSQFKGRTWNVLNSYSHSGFLQLVRRLTEETVEPNYDDEELTEVLRFSAAFALVAAVGSAQVAQNQQLAEVILAKAKEFQSSAI